jgi:acyl-CoA dehydrogenase
MPIEAAEVHAFRTEVRAFLLDRLPPDLAAHVACGGYPPHRRIRDWIATLAERGWSAPSWPREWGGAALPPRLRAILDEECALADAPAVEALGISTIGPAILAFGSPEQKARHLPPIVTAAEHWCQGFSEPGAGSDLAAIATRAIRDGDGWRVTGSKIWTSSAHDADWILCLVRTDPAAPKHHGISALMIDMRTPGVTVRPIRWMNGVHGFNEVFFDDVHVPAENLLGNENGGWAVAMHALGPERIFVSRVAENKRLLKRLREAMERADAAGHRLSGNPEFAHRAAALEVRLLALEERFVQFLDDLEAGRPVGPEVSMLKLTGSRLIQSFEALITEAYGPAVLPFDPARTSAEGLGLEVGAPAAAMAALRMLHHRGYTIAAGSSEVQLEVLTRRVLGM